MEQIINEHTEINYNRSIRVYDHTILNVPDQHYKWGDRDLKMSEQMYDIDRKIKKLTCFHQGMAAW